MMLRLAALCVALTLCCLGFQATAAFNLDDLERVLRIKKANLPPMVLVPGLTASNITYKLNNAPSNNPACATNKPTTILWPPLANETTPSQFPCWVENYAVWFDNSSTPFHSRPGESTGIQDFGGIDGIPYYKTIMQGFLKFGYKLGKNWFAAPYDFRIPLFANPGFVKNLTELVEHAYETNGNRKVVLLTASFGPMYTIGFLHQKPQAWKDKYIAWFIAESPIWSGAPYVLPYIASGLGTPGTGENVFYRIISTYAFSNTWLWPRLGNTNTTYHKDEVFAKTPSRSYGAADYAQLYADIGFSYLIPPVTEVVNDPDLANLAHPGVDTYVTFGYNVGTPGYFEWDADFVANPTTYPPMPSKYNNCSDTGDSLVPVRSSMRAAFEWEEPMKKAGKKLLYKGYDNQQHAMCIVPLSGGCFLDVLELVSLGITPKGSSVEDAKTLFASLVPDPPTNQQANLSQEPEKLFDSHTRHPLYSHDHLHGE